MTQASFTTVLAIASIVFLVYMNRWMVHQGFPSPVRLKVSVMLAIVAVLASWGLMWMLRMYVLHQDVKRERDADAPIKVALTSL
ncbi:hypothetical protein [Rufibacter tibetensis]|uniref:Uncharacterized protein n=1 Tax=Rufibacter tibetensis TaxID=512763 RepID=A0A0P0D0V7_9BACT|nr:hypothetical protein [Rufibacter tibetensis]ALJ00684.1 hypothetical protein DC20_19000 [Rufibacter tibetensis]